MARTPKRHDRDYYRRHLYGQWDPHQYSTVWLENDVYRQLLRDIEYYRAHPQNADPRSVLQLLSNIMAAWRDERQQFTNVMNDMIAHYKEAVNVIRGDEQEIERLQGVINTLQRQINDAIRRQNELQRQIDEIHRQKQQDHNLAIKYRNDAVKEFNSVAHDIYFQKYASDELNAINHQIEQMDRLQLADAAIQGLAVECLTRLYATRQKVERMKAEFAMLHTVVSQQAQELMEQYEKWRDDMYFDENEPQPQRHIDMNFWSRGLFAEAFQEVQNLRHNLQQAPTAPGYMIDQLERDMQTIVNLRRDGEAIVDDVMKMSLQSELVEAMGHLSTLVLCEDFYFKLVFWGYNDDDERDAYVVQLENHASGMKMQLVFTPVNQTQSVCLYQVSFLKYNDPLKADHFVNALLAELTNNGIVVSRSGKTGSQNIVEDIAFNTPGSTYHLPQELRILETQQ